VWGLYVWLAESRFDVEDGQRPAALGMDALEVNLEAVVPERLLMADRGLSRGGIAVGDFGIRWRKEYKKAKRPQRGRSLRMRW
jgi:hypothetical protein